MVEVVEVASDAAVADVVVSACAVTVVLDSSVTGGCVAADTMS